MHFQVLYDCRRNGGNVLFMCRLIWRDKPLMKARRCAAAAAETNSRHGATSHQLLETQAERKSLVASAHDESHHCAQQSIYGQFSADAGRFSSHGDRCVACFKRSCQTIATFSRSEFSWSLCVADADIVFLSCFCLSVFLFFLA